MMNRSPSPAEGHASGSVARVVREIPRPHGVSRWIHPEWADAFPWLAQGTTGRGEGGRAADFAIFRANGRADGVTSWTRLAEAEGFRIVAHARQVHGRGVLVHHSSSLEAAPAPPGSSARLLIGPDADGHVSATPGLLMGVTVADCVPVFLVDPSRRAGALLHAGWRGLAEGILGEGLEVLRSSTGSRARDIHLHLGPAICGRCYEVGREVHLALGLPDPQHPHPVDLRGVLAGRALRAGVPLERITQSAFCTRCGDSPFFSYRRGDAARQVGFLGLRTPASA